LSRWISDRTTIISLALFSSERALSVLSSRFLICWRFLSRSREPDRLMRGVEDEEEEEAEK
jgi:hypothetical protein